MEVEDPWDWSIDRVVQELCTPNRSWHPPTSTSTPDLTKLASVLREQEVNGSVFLLDIDDDVLRKDFDIKTLGQKAFVRRAIEELRSKSAHYQAYVQEHFSRSFTSTLRRPSVAGLGGPFPPFGLDSALPFGQQQQQQQQQQIGQGPVPAIRSRPESPASFQNYLTAADYSGGALEDSPGIPTPVDTRTASGEFVVSDASGSKRRKLDHANADDNFAPLIPDSSSPQIIESDHEIVQTENVAQHIPPTPRSESAPSPIPENNGKKPKRIAPTLISSQIDPSRDREIPSDADNVVHNNPQIIEPGVVFFGDDGIKRLVPIRQSDPNSDLPLNYNDLRKPGLVEEQILKSTEQIVAERKVTVKKTKRPKSNLSVSQAKGYLGKVKIPVDDIFYKGTEVGQELPASEDPTEFSEVARQISSGRRLYIHHVMKNFLRSERQVFERDGKSFIAILPYPTKLAERFHKPSFTLFYTKEDGKACSRREELQSWPEVDPDAPPQKLLADGDDNRVTFNSGVLHELGSYGETFDPDSLAKYRHVQGGDEVLPIYGESDEENEYDLDTWAEIEGERGTLVKPLKPLKKPHLSIEEVNKAIDEGIAELVVKWKKEKLPKNQAKALRLWTKFRKNREARRERIRVIQKRLYHITDDRIPKLRKEIVGEIWTSQRQVRRQTRIMEQTIFDRESSIWEISIIESKVAPERPPQKLSKSTKPRARAEEDGEGELIESDLETSSPGEDEFDDFIVDDTSSSGEPVEMDFADSEDDDSATSSDASLDNLTKTSFAVRTKPSKNSIKGRASNDDVDYMSDGSNEESGPVKPVATNPRTPGHPSTPNHTKKSTPPGFSHASLNSASEPIDLTMLSDDSPLRPVTKMEMPKKKKPLIKLTNHNSPLSSSPIVISDEELPLPDMDNLPPYDDPDAIAKFSHEAWASVSDRERLLISVLKEMNDAARTAIFSFISNVSETELWDHMSGVIGALLKAKSSLKGVDDNTFETLINFIKLFNTYVDCKYHARKKPSERRLLKLQSARNEWFPAFYLLCRKLESYFRSSLMDGQEDDGNKQLEDKRERAVNTITDDGYQGDAGSQRKKRKRKIYEDKEARDMREQDRLRLDAQEQRRKKLQSKLTSIGHIDGQHQIIINDGKFEHQGFVYVNEQIAPRIKPHQIDGVRFMWNQIVTDEKAMQGCLLAHTMGLGKTMQVITLLVAIAEASASPDESVYSQVPPSLRVSRTLVLCPAGLIDNWMDELLTWSPKDLLGHFRKVDTTVKTPERLQVISDWYHDGGVLILGYEMFRSLYENKTTAKRRAPLNEEDHKTVKDQLLNGPNIIVADEAHKMKNANSAIAQSTAQFRSKSRIALTGSPLANNVAEYHTMIDWVAPNYLGPALEFRVKYVEPIQDGLWHDSTASDRRRSLKMLGVLKEDLAPKVHRADMSVLRNDLPPKKEFVITVPLTDLQRKVYSLYVQSMVSGQTKEVSQTTVWHWLAILSLLCNHPECFNRKLNERKEEARKERGVLSGSISRTGTDQATDQSTDQAEIIAAELNAPVWKVGVSQELINAVTEVFKQEASDLKAINLSNKVKILCQILDASKEAGDKVLVFSQSLHTLDFLEHLCITQGRKYARLDGSTTISKRQESTKAFNVSNTELYLISTAAGGLGLNIFGANRVVIFDFKFNPIMEEQAVGRAYRIGQKKPVFVYRFVAGGTFEDSIHNKAVFKMQLASRVVDKKSPVAWASKRVREFLFEPKFVEQKDLSEFVGMDPLVLDKVLASQTGSSTIRAIVQTDTFEQDDQDKLTAEEEVEVKRMLSDEKLKRSNPRAFQELIQKRNALQLDQQMGQTPGMLTNLSAISKAPSYLRVPTIEGSASFTDHSPILNPPRQSSLTGASNSSLSGSPIGAPSFVPPVVTPPDDAAQTSASANAENKTSRDPFHFTRGRSPITGAHTRVRSVSSVDAEDRPVPVLRTELPHRSPILGAHTKIRSASPKDRPAPVRGTELAHRSLITGAHTRARSVSSVSSDSAEDRPVPVPRTELPHRSPILGAHTKIRSASPKDRPAPVLGTELAHRSRSISPEFGMSNYSQLSNKHPSGVTPNSDQRRRKQKVGNLPTAPQKMENLFVDVLKKAYESSFESVFEPLQTATMVSKGILEALADYSTEDTIKSFVEKAAAALRANKDKCQALADLRITPRSFVRSIVKPSRMLRSSSSGSAFADIKESEMFKAMNRPAPRSLRTPVAGPSKSGRKRHSHAADDARQMQRIFRRRAAQSPSTSSSRSTPNPDSATSRKIPKWAQSEIREASRGLNHRRVGSHGIPSARD